MSIWNTRFRRGARVMGARGGSASTRPGAWRGTMRGAVFEVGREYPVKSGEV